MRKLNNNELNRITVEEYKNAKKTPIVIVLDNVRSAHNVGAIFRTSDAFLIEKIFLCGITPCPPNNEIRKSALGSTNSVDWAYESDTNNILNNLKKSGYRIVGVEQVENSTKLSNLFVLKLLPLDNISIDSNIVVLPAAFSPIMTFVL